MTDYQKIIDSRLSNIENMLLDIKNNPSSGPPHPDPEEFLSVLEAANFLKFSVNTMYNIIHDKRIPFMKSAKKCYFLKTDLVKYLKKGRRKSLEETAAEANNYIEKKKG
jgi:excisionase family DNA binding protein